MYKLIAYINQRGCKMLDSEFKIPVYLEDPMFKLALEIALKTKQIPYDHVQNKNTLN